MLACFLCSRVSKTRVILNVRLPIVECGIVSIRRRGDGVADLSDVPPELPAGACLLACSPASVFASPQIKKE